MSKVCVCAVCHFGPAESEVPSRDIGLVDVFCSIGDKETGEDGQVRTRPGYIRPFFSNDSTPEDCSKFQAHRALMQSRRKKVA